MGLWGGDLCAHAVGSQSFIGWEKVSVRGCKAHTYAPFRGVDTAPPPVWESRERAKQPLTFEKVGVDLVCNTVGRHGGVLVFVEIERAIGRGGTRSGKTISLQLGRGQAKGFGAGGGLCQHAHFAWGVGSPSRDRAGGKLRGYLEALCFCKRLVDVKAYDVEERPLAD